MVRGPVDARRQTQEARRQTAGRLSPQEILRTAPIGYREGGQTALAELQRQAATPRDLHAVGDRLGQIGEQLRHLRRRAQVLLRRVAPLARGIGELRAVVDADPGLVGLEVLRCKEAHIVGRDQGHPFRSRQRGGRRHQRLFALAADPGDFEIEAITQEFPPRREVTHRLRATARRQRPPHITLRTAGQRDQTCQARRA